MVVIAFLPRPWCHHFPFLPSSPSLLAVPPCRRRRCLPSLLSSSLPSLPALLIPPVVFDHLGITGITRGPTKLMWEVSLLPADVSRNNLPKAIEYFCYTYRNRRFNRWDSIGLGYRPTCLCRICCSSFGLQKHIDLLFKLGNLYHMGQPMPMAMALICF